MSKQILLVEDQNSCAMLLTLILEQQSLQVHRARDGQEALKMMETFDVEGVITDLFMPDMDGLAFLDAIQPLIKRVPVIVVTGSNTPEVNEKLSLLGVEHVFKKPIMDDDITQIAQLMGA